MCTHSSRRFRPELSVSALILAAALMTVPCGLASAQQSPLSAPAAAVHKRAQLEKAFWLCDYTATERGVHATPVGICSVITDELKNEKFGGDFEQFLKWWRANKQAQHQMLAAGAASTIVTASE